MAFNDSPLLKFKKSANDVWLSRPRRGYLGTITRSISSLPFNLTIDSGVGSIGDFSTLRQAKNAFRKFLLDKPVNSSVIAAPASGPLFSASNKNTDISLSLSDALATNDGSASALLIEWIYMASPINVSGGGKFYLEIDLGGTITSSQHYIGFDCVNNESDLASIEGGNFGSNSWPWGYVNNISDTIYTRRDEVTVFRTNALGASANIASMISSWGSGDTVMLAFDIDNDKFWIGVNGSWGVGHDPATNTGGLSMILTKNLLYPTLALPAADTGTAQLIEEGSISYSVPGGFSYLN
jgi:hypothetical protein